MIVETVRHGIRYTLSNENLQPGDKVYPIARGRCLDNNGWALHEITFEDYMTGFPDDPHTIEKLEYSDYKPYQVKTDKGFSPIEAYYKIIKKEEQIREHKGLFATHKWVEIE